MAGALSLLPGIEALRAQTLGDPAVCVAILDGVVAVEHPCLAGAALKRLPTMVQERASATGSMSLHGTHVTSLIFGQPGTAVEGIAPGCRGVLLPVFGEARRRVSQLDLARAIEQAAAAGAHVINISGGEVTRTGLAEPILERAVATCRERGVLIVAAAGNDGCNCLHLPAAMPEVLTVGAADAAGHPLSSSNWGQLYRDHGVLAPGENIVGAAPDNGVAALSGTSVAAPLVTGIIALLLSLQRRAGQQLDPYGLRDELLASARPCPVHELTDLGQCLAGVVSVPLLDIVARSQHNLPWHHPMSQNIDTTSSPTSSRSGAPLAAGAPAAAQSAAPGVQPSTCTCGAMPPGSTAPAQTRRSPSMAPSFLGTSESFVFALGELAYDLYSEARRDSFKQLMPPVSIDGIHVPPTPHDARQMADYLRSNLSEARNLIWTVNLELTPIYAIEPVGPFARDVYEQLREMLSGHIVARDSDDFIERVSVPGQLTGRTVRLFSGQEVPVIEVDSTRGMYGWKVNGLATAAIESLGPQGADEKNSSRLRAGLESFLQRVYFELRNLGQTPQDRALNFAATNAFQAASAFASAVASGMELADIGVSQSPICRMDSDCWDVQLVFFDPENVLRARKHYRFTVDVSDLHPVTVGAIRSWSAPA